MICPKCRFEQGESLECIRCGIVFARFQAVKNMDKSRDSALENFPHNEPAALPKMKASYIAVIVLCLLFISISVKCMISRPVKHGPGVVAPDSPEQTKITGEDKKFKYGKYEIFPLADFKVEARVLSKKRYRLGREAELSPFDLAMGWGPMSDENNLKEIDIGQSFRFFNWWTDTWPIPRPQIEQNSANMHIIPADSTVYSKLKKVREGQVINFEGYLVKTQAGDGWAWQSSLIRTDTGDGACEVVWVETLDIRM